MVIVTNRIYTRGTSVWLRENFIWNLKKIVIIIKNDVAYKIILMITVIGAVFLLVFEQNKKGLNPIFLFSYIL